MNKHLEWLYKELPILIQKQIISQNTANSIASYYLNQSSQDKQKFSFIISFAGSICIALGIIMLFAYNWDNIPPTARFSIAILLLVLSQSLTILGIRKKNLSVKTLECFTAFESLMVGTSFALIGQTYHITNNFDMLILSWILLILPLSYLTITVSPLILYLILLPTWLLETTPFLQNFVWFLILPAMLAYKYLYTKNRLNNILAYLIIINLTIAFYTIFHELLGNLTLHTLTILFSLFYILGQYLEQKEPALHQPMSPFGTISSILCAYILTFKSSWQIVFISPKGWFIIILLTTITLLLAKYIFKLHAHCYSSKLKAILPFIILSTCIITYCFNTESYAIIILNLYLLILSINIIKDGLTQNLTYLVNSGMFLMAILILGKFFDSNFSFWIRGLIFIFIGTIFFIVNLALSHRKKVAKK